MIVKDSCSHWEARVSQSRTATKYKIMATYPELPLAWTYCLKFSHQLQSRRSSWKMCLPIIFLGHLGDLVKDLDYRLKLCSDSNVDANDHFWFIQGAFLNWSSQFSVPKWKMMGSQSDILFHEILNVQKILVGWTTFFFCVLKFGWNS